MDMQQALALPDEIIAEVDEAKQFGASLTITDEDSYANAVTFVAERIQPGIKRIEEWFKPLVDAAFNAHRALTTARGDALAPYRNLKAQVDADATRWRKKQQQLRIEQQRKEREKALADAEARRVEQASALAESGDEEAAVELLAAPLVPKAAPTIAVSVPHVAGVVATKRWRAVENEYVTFLKWVVESPEERLQYLKDTDGCSMYNKRLLDQLATSQRKGFSIPGFTAEEVESTQFRAR